MAKSGEELAKSHKPVSDMKCEAPEDDHPRRTSVYAEPSTTAENSDAPQDPQNGSAGFRVRLRHDLSVTHVGPNATKEDTPTHEHSAISTRKSGRTPKP